MSYREQTPQLLSILIRKLKPGKTFEDFQQAHLPPGKATKTEFGYDVDYFTAPTRVIDAVSAADPSMIVSIGLSYGDAGVILKEVGNKIPFEKERHDKIAEVADKISAQVFFVGADNNFGFSDSSYTQLPLTEITPEILAALNLLVPQKQTNLSED